MIPPVPTILRRGLISLVTSLAVSTSSLAFARAPFSSPPLHEIVQMRKIANVLSSKTRLSWTQRAAVEKLLATATPEATADLDRMTIAP